jgi:hypothetical protein
MLVGILNIVSLPGEVCSQLAQRDNLEISFRTILPQIHEGTQLHKET